MNSGDPTDAASTARREQLFIGGRFVDAVSGRAFETRSPHDGSLLATVAEADAADVDLAVAAARRAFEEGPWRSMPVGERGKVLWRIGDRIEAQAFELAQLESQDVGMPLWLSSGMILQAADVFRYWAGMASKLHGATGPAGRPGDYLGYSLREPLGVVGGITPWNGPLIMAAWKTAPALACGNAVVLKPAELTPLTAMALARICAETGLPEGLLNVVPGRGATAGAALALHPGVDKVAFTGATSTGKTIVQASTSNLKHITLELGGKSPHIVFEDVDVEVAVSNALLGLYANSGQICTAGTRLLIHEAIHDRFVERFVERSRAIRLGEPLGPMTQLGPLVSAAQRDKVERYIEVGREEGATLACGGERPSAPELSRGFYVQPTVFVDVDNRMRIAQEEIFGPVAAVIRFRDEDDAVRIANDVVYGLAAGIQTRDLKRAHRVARRLEAGSVWINTWHMIETTAPFGGVKLSGYGRENGLPMVEHLTRLKQVWVDLNDFTMDVFAG